MSEHYSNAFPYAGAQAAGMGFQNPAQAQYAQQQYAQQQYFAQQAAQQQAAQTSQAKTAQAKTAVAAPGTGLASWFNVTQPAYLKGLLLGAGVALVVTNPTVQKALIGGAVRVWAAVQGGVEEIKEQIEDVKAELSREG